MSEQEMPDGNDDTVIDGLPILSVGEEVAENNGDTEMAIMPAHGYRDPTEKAVDHYPLPQMHRLAFAIEQGSDEQVRRMHGVFLSVFGAAKKNFSDWLRSLDNEEEMTPTALYVIDTDGQLLPVADLVTEIIDNTPVDSGFLSLSMDMDPANESPVFALTRVKSRADTDDIIVTWDDFESGKLDVAIAQLDELIGLETLGTGDEITARKLPPVEPIENKNTDGLPDLSAFAELLPTTPTPGFVLTVTPSFATYNESTPRRDTRVLVLKTRNADDMTPTPRREAPQWVLSVFNAAKNGIGFQGLTEADVDRMIADGERSAE